MIKKPIRPHPVHLNFNYVCRNPIYRLLKLAAYCSLGIKMKVKHKNRVPLKGQAKIKQKNERREMVSP